MESPPTNNRRKDILANLVMVDIVTATFLYLRMEYDRKKLKQQGPFQCCKKIQSYLKNKIKLRKIKVKPIVMTTLTNGNSGVQQGNVQIEPGDDDIETIRIDVITNSVNDNDQNNFSDTSSAHVKRGKPEKSITKMRLGFLVLVTSSLLMIAAMTIKLDSLKVTFLLADNIVGTINNIVMPLVIIFRNENLKVYAENTASRFEERVRNLLHSNRITNR